MEGLKLHARLHIGGKFKIRRDLRYYKFETESQT